MKSPFESLRERNLENASLREKLLQREKFLQEGRNQVLYLLLAIGDENVAHDNYHPDKSHFLYETRLEIVRRLKQKPVWPTEWPDFTQYTYTPG